MKRVFHIVSCLIVSCLPLLVAAQNDQTVNLEKRVTIVENNEPLEKIFDELSAQTRLYFSYDPTVLDVKKQLTVNYQNWTVEDILNDLLKDSYKFRLLKNQVIITKKEESLSETIPVKKTVEPFFVLSGHLTDALNDQQIPYASVSVLGKTYGTITNIDGDFEIKVPNELRKDTLYISCMGYAQYYLRMDTLTQSNLLIDLQPIDIRLGEVKVTAIKALDVIDKLLENRKDNYPTTPYLMTAFYREVLKQDDKYMNVSEAVMNILKASYSNAFREDRIKFLKGRKSPDVSPFEYVEFKMQGGPYYITKLDVIKTMDTFLDEAYREMYEYRTDELIEYLGRPTYVIRFRPREKVDFLSYEGKLFIDKETFALVHAEFELGRDGLKFARRSLVRKKPKNLKVRPIDLNYQVTYKENNGKWHLNTAQISVKFKVRSKEEKINSVFHSVSDLLITDAETTELRRFDREETINPNVIFTEMIIDYDKEFWGNFNIIKPNEDLRNAIESKKPQSENHINQLHNPSNLLTKKPH